MTARERTAAASATALLLSVAGGCIEKPEGSDMSNQAAIELFKTRVGFDAAPAAGPADQGLVVEWPDPLRYAYFREGGWKIQSSGIRADVPGMGRALWVIRRGESEAVVAIEIAVSSLGAARARSYLLETASNTMAPAPPYERGPEGIGDICISSRELPEQHTLMSVYRNVFVKLRREDGADLPALAREIRALLGAQHVETLTGRLPHLDRFEVSPESVAVGESVEAKVALAPEVSRRYLLRIADPSQHLLAVSDKGTRVTFQAATPGVAEVTAMVVDKSNLLSSFERFEVGVREP